MADNNSNGDAAQSNAFPPPGQAPAAEDPSAQAQSLDASLELTQEGRLLLGLGAEPEPAQGPETEVGGAAPVPQAETKAETAAAAPAAFPSAPPAARPRGRYALVTLGAAGLVAMLALAALGIWLLPKPQHAPQSAAAEEAMLSASALPHAAQPAPMGEDGAAGNQAEPAAPAQAANQVSAHAPVPRPPALRRPGQQLPPWPAAQVTPLTLARVAHLDCHSLRAGVADSTQAPGLRAWAQFRLAWSCNEGAAAQHVVPPPHKRHIGADAMLHAAAYQGLTWLQRGTPAPLHGYGDTWHRTPQGRLVDALTGQHGPLRQRQRALEKLQQVRSLGDDGPFAVALLQDRRAPEAALSLYGRLVAEGDVAALARSAQALWQHEAFAPLVAALHRRNTQPGQRRGPGLLRLPKMGRDTDVAAEALPLEAAALLPQLVQASPAHRRFLLDLALRYQVLVGNLVGALELGRLHESLAPHDAAVRQQNLRLLRLLRLGDGDVPAPAQPPATAHDDSAAPRWAAPKEGVLAALLARQKAAQQRGDVLEMAEVAAALLWHDPTAQDPLPLLYAWLDGLVLMGGEGRSLGLEGLERLVKARVQDDGPLTQTARIVQRAIMAELEQAPAHRSDGQALLALKQRRTGALEALLLRHPSDAGLGLNLAEALAEQGEEQRAQQLFASLEANVPVSLRGELLYVKARLVAQKDPLQARLLLTESNQLQPNAKNDIFLAELLAAHGQLEEAAVAMGRAATARPEDLPLQLGYADLLLQVKNSQGALALLKRAQKRFPNQLAVRERTSDVQHQLGDLAGAAASLRAALALPQATADNPGRLWLALGRLELLERGHLDAGIAALEQAVQHLPDCAEAHYLLGLGLRDANQLPHMRTAWRRYLKLAPNGTYAAEVRTALAR